VKNKLSKKEALEKIELFFKKDNLDPIQVKKMKRLAMKYKIRLGIKRRRFCKKCLADLKKSKIRTTRCFKSVECRNCGFKNRWKINSS